MKKLYFVYNDKNRVVGTVEHINEIKALHKAKEQYWYYTIHYVTCGGDCVRPRTGNPEHL